ncbi:MAG: MFS transporter [Chthoniobacterales bacterium]|nr:MFS transporter [Chthoniobacterales bacterium]
MRAVPGELRIVLLALKQIPTTETARVPEEITGRQRRIPVGKITFGHTFRALRHRNYRLFFYGQLVSLIGTWMQSTAMSWLIYQITGSKLLLGVVAAVASAPMMFLSLWGGAIADRIQNGQLSCGRRRRRWCPRSHSRCSLGAGWQRRG